MATNWETDRDRLQGLVSKMVGERVRASTEAPKREAPRQASQPLTYVDSADRMAKLNAAFERRLKAMTDFAHVVSTNRKQLIVPLIQQKGEAWRAWAQLLQAASHERDPVLRAELEAEAAHRRQEVTTLEQQIAGHEDMSADLADLKAEIEAAEREIEALGGRLSGASSR